MNQKIMNINNAIEAVLAALPDTALSNQCGVPREYILKMKQSIGHWGLSSQEKKDNPFELMSESESMLAKIELLNESAGWLKVAWENTPKQLDPTIMRRLEALEVVVHPTPSATSSPKF